MRWLLVLILLAGCLEDEEPQRDCAGRHAIFRHAPSRNSLYLPNLAAAGTLRASLVCDGGTAFYGERPYDVPFTVESDSPEIVSGAPEPGGVTIHALHDGVATVRIIDRNDGTSHLGSLDVTVMTIDHLAIRFSGNVAYADLLAGDGTRLMDDHAVLSLPPGATPYLDNSLRDGSFEYMALAAGTYTVKRTSGGTMYSAELVVP
jgi:hypothetical protein